MLPITILLGLALSLSTCAAYTQTTQVSQPTSSECPDQLASEACASFAQHKHDLGKGEIVCFRQGKDEYFDLSYGSYQTASWDKVGKDGSPTSGANAKHLFTAATVDHGVENYQIMPHGRVRGTWHSNGTYSLSTNDKAEHISLISDANSLTF